MAQMSESFKGGEALYLFLPLSFSSGTKAGAEPLTGAYLSQKISLPLPRMKVAGLISRLELNACGGSQIRSIFFSSIISGFFVQIK